MNFLLYLFLVKKKYFYELSKKYTFSSKLFLLINLFFKRYTYFQVLKTSTSNGNVLFLPETFKNSRVMAAAFLNSCFFSCSFWGVGIFDANRWLYLLPKSSSKWQGQELLYLGSSQELICTETYNNTQMQQKFQAFLLLELILLSTFLTPTISEKGILLLHSQTQYKFFLQNLTYYFTQKNK